MVHELESDNLSEIIQSKKHVIVQYSASWCGNCRIMKPKFKKIAAEYSDYYFVLADAENFPESRKLAQVDNLPTFAVFSDGKIINQVQTNKLDPLKNLVDEVTNN